MKSKNNGGRKKRKSLSQTTKYRWLPTDNTRPTVFKDRKKEQNKKACRKNYDQ